MIKVVAPCRCGTAEEAERCRRAGMAMHGPLWNACRGNERLRAWWDSIADWDRQPSGGEKLASCIHRGRRLQAGDGGVVVELCGGS